jgi:membrane-bound lytic murein transglycosylase D
MPLLLIFLVLGLWLWPGGPAAEPPPAPVPPAAAVIAPETFHWPYYRLPQKLYLCGEPVPLSEPEVREDLDREFTIVVWSRIQTTMWLKRAHRHFPEIEKKLRAKRLPLDLKYVVLVESDLRPRARSSAGALGPWQFIGPTAQRFQLKANDSVDERLDFGPATDAALSYLTELYQLFRSWPLALAAYNCGEGQVQKALAVQGVQDYYHLSLPEETERYVLRILATKIVMEAPARYGYEIPPEDLYPPLDYDEATFTVTQEVPVRRLAEACGSYYKNIKRLNPWIKGASLSPGSYRLKIPKGTAPRFYEAYRKGQLGGGG